MDIIVYDGLDELDALGPFEVLRRAERLGGEVTVRLVTRRPQVVVQGGHGLRLVSDGVYEPGADIIIVPGGGWIDRSGCGAWGEVQRGDWLPLLASAPLQGTRLIAGVCTGTMVLAHAGIIGQRRATTHRRAWADLAATGALVVEDRVVDDGDLLTCGGVTSGLDLALWLAERELSADLAGAVATDMEYSRTPPSTLR